MPLKLHKFGEAWGLADPSPFCLKLESFMREANIAYDVVPFDARRSFGKAPKGKLPFIEDENGELVGDSTLIIERLSRRHRVDLDAPLDDRQRCVSLAFRRMLDEHLYWVGAYSRWIDEPGRSTVRATLLATLPRPFRPIASAMARRSVTRALHAQGTGRHTRAVIYALGREDMAALSGLLGEDPYFFATDGPTLLDLWSHAFVGEIIAPPIDSPLKAATSAFDNLVSHFRRVQARLYP
jgi:glutathione S-transferase